MSMPTYSGAITIKIFNNLQTDYLNDFNDDTLKKLSDHNHEGSGTGNPIHGVNAIQAGTIDTASYKDASITAAKLAASLAFVTVANNVYMKWRNNADLADLDVFKINVSDNLELEQDIDKIRYSNNINIIGATSAGADYNLFKVNGSDQWEFLNSAYTQHLICKTTSTYDVGSATLKYDTAFVNNIRFGTGTSDLDTYEEGTFTPTLGLGGGSAGATYSVQEGNYTRIGNIVNFTILMTMTAKGSGTGNATIEGLPFTSAARAQSAGSVIFHFVKIDTPDFYHTAVIEASSTLMTLSVIGDNVSITVIQHSDINEYSTFYVTGFYLI